MAMQQIDRKGADACAILHRRSNLLRKPPPGCRTARWAAADMGAMFRDDERSGLGQVEHLSSRMRDHHHCTRQHRPAVYACSPMLAIAATGPPSTRTARWRTPECLNRVQAV